MRGEYGTGAFRMSFPRSRKRHRPSVREEPVEIIESPPTAQEYLALRVKAGLSPKSVKAAEIGLPNSLYAVQFRTDGKLVAMGRVVGDGPCFFQVVDIAVDPDYQGRGLGRAVMERVDTYLRSTTLDGSYVSLIADQPEFYRKVGYKGTVPSIGMYKTF